MCSEILASLLTSITAAVPVNSPWLTGFLKVGPGSIFPQACAVDLSLAALGILDTQHGALKELLSARAHTCSAPKWSGVLVLWRKPWAQRGQEPMDKFYPLSSPRERIQRHVSYVMMWPKSKGRLGNENASLCWLAFLSFLCLLSVPQSCSLESPPSEVRSHKLLSWPRLRLTQARKRMDWEWEDGTHFSGWAFCS